MRGGYLTDDKPHEKLKRNRTSKTQVNLNLVVQEVLIKVLGARDHRFHSKPRI